VEDKVGPLRVTKTDIMEEFLREDRHDGGRAPVEFEDRIEDYEVSIFWEKVVD
jgi:hypothetical protein